MSDDFIQGDYDFCYQRGNNKHSISSIDWLKEVYVHVTPVPMDDGKAAEVLTKVLERRIGSDRAGEIWLKEPRSEFVKRMAAHFALQRAEGLK